MCYHLSVKERMAVVTKLISSHTHALMLCKLQADKLRKAVLYKPCKLFYKTEIFFFIQVEVLLLHSNVKVEALRSLCVEHFFNSLI